jgi:predicted RecB family nuclease
MSVPISDRLFLDYLQCKYKAYLKLLGKSGVKSDFEKFQDEKHVEYRQRAREHRLITGRSTPPPEVNCTFKDVQKRNLSIAIDISISNDKNSLILDAAELALQSTLRKPIYNPIIFLPHQKIGKQHKLLLAFYGSALSHEQQAEPISGRIIFGDSFSSTKVQLASLMKTTGKIEKEITRMVDTQTAPLLRLNNHCKICEFQEVCYAAAKGRDDLSLLKGLSGKEIDKLNKRGIFTVTQYSYTFRPRRVNKSATQRIIKHHHSLNALAIRTRTIYIAGKPAHPSATTRVYLDVEGIPDENFYYLIGLLIDDGKSIVSHSFWANDKSEERTIWKSFLEIIGMTDNFVMFHYGSYESKFIKQMGTLYGGNTDLLEKLRSDTFNVLSAIYGNIYFPAYSNDLKSIASFLRFKWSDHNASGLTSLLWRQQWERSADEIWKQKITTYNHEDCIALRVVEKGLQSIATTDNSVESCSTKNIDELKTDKPLSIFKRNQFHFPELEKINKCAYFDYQRSKVYLRTSSEVKKAMAKRGRMRKAVCKVNKDVILNLPRRCPLCRAFSPIKHAKKSRIVYDLKMSTGGVKRWVIRYNYSRCLCKECNRTFCPPKSQTIVSSKYGRNLFAWLIYQNIGRLKSQSTIIEDLGETFGYWFPYSIVAGFKTIAADYYKKSYDNLIRKISKGDLIHIDETKISTKGTTNYVWAVTNMDSVIYTHSSTREGEMIKEKLSGFKGVLVSDFYTAYDSFPCQQQKCLIHLIRDINEDILKNPFDEELREMGKDFTMILSPIIETIDKYGLKQRYFNKHNSKVRGFFEKIQQKEYTSDLAKNFQRRFLKYRGKLFTFLAYDGVPWNNNNAEHAIKSFVFLRKVIGGSSTAKGIQEYPVLLSICETLRLRNASFLKFLISGATDIDKFLETKTSRPA